MFVKICGITSPAAAEAAVRAGADAVGFVFAASVRRVTPREARAIAAELPEGVLRVAVLRHPAPELVAEVLEELAPDWLQTDAEDLESLELPAACRPLPVYRSGGRTTRRLPERLLFEGPVSGSGRTADWAEARTLAGRAELILAGGLDARNVASAISAVRPWGVDVSSGVERSPGIKDRSMIVEFVARARAAAEAAASPDARAGGAARAPRGGSTDAS